MRVRVKDVLDLLAASAARAEVLAHYPYLEEADIVAVFEFAAKQKRSPSSAKPVAAGSGSFLIAARGIAHVHAMCHAHDVVNIQESERRAPARRVHAERLRRLQTACKQTADPPRRATRTCTSRPHLSH